MKTGIVSSLALSAISFFLLFAVNAARAAEIGPGVPAASADSAAVARIQSRLSTDRFRRLARVSVDSDGHGMVFLSGQVATRREAERAIAIALATEGVSAVKSDIGIAGE